MSEATTGGEMSVNGVELDGLRLCPQCEAFFVPVGYCLGCTQWNERMEAKRVEERQFLAAVGRVDAGVAPFAPAPFEALDRADDMPLGAAVAILCALVFTAGLTLIGGWVVGKHVIWFLLAHS